MKNITVKIDDETYRQARLKAAAMGTSVSAMVRSYLASMAADSDEANHRRMVTELKKIYAEAEARATPRTEPFVPLTREEIYAERLR
jgi:hypothetical protein